MMSTSIQATAHLGQPLPMLPPQAAACASERRQPKSSAGRLNAGPPVAQAGATTSLSATEADDLHRKAVQAALDLRRHGWASLEGILPQEECRTYEDGFWDWIEKLGTGVRRDNPTTWQSPAWPPSFRGIINSLEVAHQAFVWRVRKHPRILKVFEELWGSRALLSSFDSINALPPTAAPQLQSWLHTDQAPWRRGCICVQGLVNLVDVAPQTTGSLLVKDGSHLEHEAFFTSASQVSQEEQRKAKDFYQFTEDELPFWERFDSVGVQGRAGSLFLWDSRTVHANVFPSKSTAFRHVVYTCFQPAAMASDEQLAKKRRAYQEHRLTTHWPAMNLQLFDKATEYYGVEGSDGQPKFRMHRTREQVEDRRLLQLAGMETYGPEECHNRVPLLELSVEQLQALLMQDAF